MIRNTKHLNLYLTPDIILIINEARLLIINYLLQSFVESCKHLIKMISGV